MKLFKFVTGVLIVAVIAVGLWLIIFGPPIDDSALNRSMEPFTEQGFSQAQADEALILLNFHRPFCPSCQQQKRVIARYFIDFPDSHVKVFEISYNDSPDLVNRFRAADSTTLVMFRGEQRIWYNHGQIETPPIYSALREAEYHTHLFAEDED